MAKAPTPPSARGHRLRRAAAKLGFRISKLLGSDCWRVRTANGEPVIVGDTARVEAFISEQTQLLAA
jgi:hypothetical protein